MESKCFNMAKRNSMDKLTDKPYVLPKIQKNRNQISNDEQAFEINTEIFSVRGF